MRQGCQIFRLYVKHTKVGKYIHTKWSQNIPIGRKIHQGLKYQMDIKYTKINPKYNELFQYTYGIQNIPKLR
jgi:hypothetical protein